MNDGYMGSGKVIRSAIRKHGVGNFVKTILETFESSSDMFAREKEVVTEQFLLREDVYNLRRGGTGGFDYINNSGMAKFTGTHTDQTKKKIATKLSGNKNSAGAIRSDEYRNKMSRALSGRPARFIDDAEKERIRQTLKAKSETLIQPFTCPHCGKEGKGPVMFRYHFQNCKAGKVFMDTR